MAANNGYPTRSPDNPKGDVMSAWMQREGLGAADMPVGTRMSYWIARTLNRVRTRAGIHERTMAELMGVDARTIKRWEAGDSFGRRSELDRAIAGYAYVLGMEDGRELWQDALDWWRAEGAPPEFIPVEGPAAAFAEAIRLEALRQKKPATPSKPSKRAATPKRRGAGG